jgi:hypothetical protein
MDNHIGITDEEQTGLVLSIKLLFGPLWIVGLVKDRKRANSGLEMTYFSILWN